MTLREYLSFDRFQTLFIIEQLYSDDVLRWYEKHRPELMDRSAHVHEIIADYEANFQPFTTRAAVYVDGIEDPIALLREDGTDNFPSCHTRSASGDVEGERQYLKDLDSVRRLALRVFDDPAEAKFWINNPTAQFPDSAATLLRRGKTHEVVEYLTSILEDSDAGTDDTPATGDK